MNKFTRTVSLLLGVILLFIAMAIRWEAPQLKKVDYPNFSLPKTEDCSHELLGAEIPSITVHDRSQLYYCWGKTHGEWRGWQADYLRRLASARSSEILGPGFIQSDVLFQLLNLTKKARELFLELDFPTQSLLWSYSLGVTHGMRLNLKNKDSLFKNFGYVPDEWHPTDTLSLILLKSFAQTRKTLQQDLWESQLVEEHGENVGELLEHGDLPWESTILKAHEVPSVRSDDVAQFKVQEIGKVAGVQDGFQILDGTLSILGGSNNWVVSGKRSSSGNAWLANDPHLELERPAFFQWARLRWNDLTVFGASVPGLPIVVSGLNQNVSWGVTNAYLDVMDASMVRDGEWKKHAEGFHPRTLVKLGPVYFDFKLFFKKLYRLKSGQLVLPDSSKNGASILVKWTGFDLEATDFGKVFELIESQSASELHKSLSTINIPAWNFVMADTKGNIGYVATGKIPLFSPKRWYGIKEQKLSEFLKTEFLPNSQKPSLFNPSRGYIASANNRHWPEGSPHFGGRAYYGPFRSYRVEQLIQETDRHSFESFKKIQCDVQMTDILMMSELVFGWHKEWKKEIEALKAESFIADIDCKNCFIFRYAMEQMKDNWSQTEAGIYRLAKAGFSEKEKMEIEKLLVEAKALSSGKVWGDHHATSFPHLSLDPKFEQKSLSTPGDEFTVSPGSGHFDEDKFDHQIGAAHRLVIEMSEPPKVYGLLIGENHEIGKWNLNDADGPWKKWANCDYSPIELFK